MNLIDQQTVDALQQSLGYQPLGAPGFGPAFGSLPASAQLPPGATTYPGASFFGPQLSSPRHLQFGSGFMGQMFGLGVEQFMAGRGYVYMPRGADVMDVLRAREFERGLERAVNVGERMDEQRLASAIERGMRAAMGFGGPAASATAASLASFNAPIMQALGLFQYMPGGSAADFARHMYLAGQNMRSFVRDRYEEGALVRGEFRLGLPTETARGQIQRLLDFFTPAGQFDPARTRGLQLGELGQLAGGLTRFGLLSSDVSPRDIEETARRLGLDRSRMESADYNLLQPATRTLNIGRQLQAYADIVGTLREMLGAPDAPIPKIINELQSLTAGTFQEMNPQTINTLLNRVRETARAANISMTTMMEVVKTGAVMGQQVGISPVLAGQVAMRAVTDTVVAQTNVTGAFEGRMNPEFEASVRQQWMMRGVRSPGMTASVQALRLLETVDRSRLTASQQAVFDQIQNQARMLNWRPDNLDQLLGLLGQVGVGANEARPILLSQAGVQTYIEQNPELLRTLGNRQVIDTRMSLQRVAATVWGQMRADPAAAYNVTAIRNAAQRMGVSDVELMNLIAQSYSNAPRGTADERIAWLRRQGVPVDQIELSRIFMGIEGSPFMQRELRGRNLENMSQLSQMLSSENQAAMARMDENIAVGMAGRQLLQSANITARGTAVERVFGAISRGRTGVGDILAAAFNFVPIDELLGQFDPAAMRRVTDARAAVDAAEARLGAAVTDADRERATADLTAARQRLNRESNAVISVIQNMPGLADTAPIHAVLRGLTSEQVKWSRRLGDAGLTPEQRVSALRHLVENAPVWTGEQIGAAAAAMPAGEGDYFARFMTTFQEDIANAQAKLRQYDVATGRERAVLRHELANMGETLGGLPMIERQMRRAIQTTAGRGGRPRTIQGRAERFNRMIELTNKLSRAKTPEERRRLFEEMSVAGAAGEGVWYKIDPTTGEAVVNEDFVREMVMMDRTMAGDSKAQAQRADEIRTAISNQLVIGGIVTAVPLGELGETEINKLAEDVGRVGEQRIGFGGKTYSDLGLYFGARRPIDTRALMSGELTDEERQLIMDPRASDAALKNLGARTGRDLIGKRRVFRAVEAARNMLRRVAGTEEGAAAQYEAARRTFERYKGELLKDGKIAPEAYEALVQLYGQERANAIAEGIVGTIGPGASTERGGRKAKAGGWGWYAGVASLFGLEETPSDTQRLSEKLLGSEGEPAGDGAKATSSTVGKIVLRDGRTGQETGTVYVDYIPESGGAGREASRKIVPNDGQPVI